MKVCHLSFPHQIPFLPSIEINFSLPQWKKINVIFLILKGTDFFFSDYWCDLLFLPLLLLLYTP